ncbi:capsid protein [Proteiniborus sp.]|uniref:capsid protein n=1 Tax=Proteiniborus sp. TaxID=2079015 RepID=UPI003319D6EB
MAINYAERFERQIEQQFARELTSADMAVNRRYNFIDAQTIKVPTVTLSGYKDHTRDGSKNRGTVGNTFQAFSLTHDRDIEFFVDEMDVDETNQVLSAANITAVFNQEQAIPELDVFRYSKLYAEFVANGGVVNTEVLTTANILTVFDKMMEDMDEAAVPQSGRMLKVTPKVYTMLKNAEKIQRTLDVSGTKGINRNVRSLDEVTIVTVPSDRMKTSYDFSDGFITAVGAKQINMMLYHASAILAPVKVADVYLWNKGETPESAFGYLYQNRMYTDLFVIKAKKDAIAINAEAAV